MILIVGGAGYIGSHVNKMLSERGYETLTFDNLVYGHKEAVKWGSFLEGDLADKQALEDLFRNNDIDAVMHFAAYTYVGESVTDPLKYYENNVSNTIHLLQAMKKAGVQKMVFSSTCATYGPPNEIPIPESHPQNPINPYGSTKLMMERIFADTGAVSDFRYAALRYFNAAGADPEGRIGEAHDPETHLIPLILDAASGKREDIKIFGTDYDTPDGTCIRDYIHVEDLADAHVRALEYLLKGGDSICLNLGNGIGFSVREVIAAVKEVTGKDFKVTETFRRPGDPPRLIGSHDKATSLLGWEPRFADLKVIVEHAWKWHLNRAF